MELRQLIPLATLLGVGLLGPTPGAAQVKDPEPASSGVTTTLPLPDGTVLYIRYGEPGGVRLTSYYVEGDSASIAPAAKAASPLQPPPTTMDLVQTVRALLREELERGSLATAAAPRPPAGQAPRRRSDPTPIWPEPRPSSPSPGPLVVVDDARRPQTAPPVIVSPLEEPRDEPQADATASLETELVVPPAATAGAALDSIPASAPMPEVPAEPELHEVEPTVIRERILHGGLFRTNLILFESAQSTLFQRSQEVLHTIGAVLSEFPEARIRVEGHADARGPEEVNLRLSEERAQVVRQFLIDCCAVAPDRLEAVGYGESRPLVSGTSPTELAMNRRVEFRVLNPEALRISAPGTLE